MAPVCLGETAVSLRVAGITVTLTGNSRELVSHLDGHLSDFLVSGGNPDVEIEAAWGLPGDVEGEKVFDAGGTWSLHRLDGDYVFRFSVPGKASRPYRMAVFDSGLRKGRIILDRSFYEGRDHVDPLEYPLDELLFMHLLSRGRGMEVHACGVVDDRGEGHLFVGQSEAGKSTMAGLWGRREGVKILSDDRIIVRRDASGYRIHGTPWHGEGRYANPGDAPLKGIYFLSHGKKNELRHMGLAEAAARMLACAFLPFYGAEELAFSMQFTEELIGSVPAYELAFIPHGEAVDMLKRWRGY